METWEPRIKLSSNPAKMTDPGRKRIERYYDIEGHPVADIVRLGRTQPAESRSREGPDLDSAGTTARRRPLYADRSRFSSFLKAVGAAARSEESRPRPVMSDGRRLEPPTNLMEIRRQAQEQVARLPEETRRLRNPESTQWDCRRRSPPTSRPCWRGRRGSWRRLLARGLRARAPSRRAGALGASRARPWNRAQARPAPRSYFPAWRGAAVTSPLRAAPRSWPLPALSQATCRTDRSREGPRRAPAVPGGRSGTRQ